jgi:hypothetical protein
MFRRLLLALLLMAAAFSARALEYTDVYYNKDEPGWGMFLVQSETFQFIALFIYGPDGKPVWYVANLDQDGTNPGSYKGTLYATTGTYFADVWDPSKLVANEVGTVSFTTSDSYHGTLVYTFNGGPTVTKQIVRQTLTPYQMSGDYSGSLVGSQTGCGDPGDNFNNMVSRFELQVAQVNDDSITLKFSFVDQDAGVVCTVSGPLTHLGRLYRVAGGQLSCIAPDDAGAPSPATIESLHPTGQGIEGRVQSIDPFSCVLNFRFSAVRR